MEDACANSRALDEMGEHFAAGFMQGDGAPVVTRMARGIRNYLARCPLPPYTGEVYYPCGSSWWHSQEILVHHYVRLNYAADRLAANGVGYRKHRAVAGSDAIEALNGAFDVVRRIIASTDDDHFLAPSDDE